MQDLEQSTRQLDGRCAELREAAAGHEHRSRESAAQVLKCNSVIERLTADLQTSKDKLKRKQVIIVRQVRNNGCCTQQRQQQWLLMLLGPSHCPYAQL